MLVAHTISDFLRIMYRVAEDLIVWIYFRSTKQLG